MVTVIQKQASVSENDNGKRLDQVAARLFDDYSRARLQIWIKSGELTVNGSIARPRDKVFEADLLVLDATLEEESRWEAMPMDLAVVYEDDDLLVINKPAGLVVHPAAGHINDTLLNALLHHCPDLVNIPRAGIVHRLDKDTSGLLVIAKTLSAHADLVEQLHNRTVKREYEAITYDVMTGGGKVDMPIGRHPSQRKKMAVVDSGKEAITHYRVIKRYPAHTHVAVKLETGRTHQIRVHMAQIRYPLVGDPVYGGRLRMPANAPEVLRENLRLFNRQALHARRLGLIHPTTGEHIEWECDLPQDMQNLLAALTNHLSYAD
jgi:23S rRNA pseudouridine1911/1915/1917 synthase